MSKRKALEESDKLTRIAIVNSDKCKPKRCRQECKKSCPVVRMGKLCIEVNPNSKIASISEELCIGCGICVKVSSSNLNKWYTNTFHFRNVHLKQSTLLIYLVIYKKKLLIVMARILLNCTDYLFLDLVKY